jgi:hypothetical protein
VIKKLTARVHRVRLQFQESWPWYLLHDNAPAHSSGIISEFLAKRGISVLSSLIYRRLTFLFPKLEIAMKGTRFEAASSSQQTVTRQLKAIREEEISRPFNSLYDRCKRCVEAGGDYIE